MTVEIPINLAYEDELSLEVLLRLLNSPNVRSSDRCFSVGHCFHGRGYGYLKKNITRFNEASKGMPYLILTDLDNKERAPLLINEWLPQTRNPNLIFRIAVREVESWLLADDAGFARFLGIAKHKMPRDPDDLNDPKQTLIALALSLIHISAPSEPMPSPPPSSWSVAPALTMRPSAPAKNSSPLSRGSSPWPCTSSRWATSPPWI